MFSLLWCMKFKMLIITIVMIFIVHIKCLVEVLNGMLVYCRIPQELGRFLYNIARCHPFMPVWREVLWKHSGLVVSPFNFQSGGQWFKPGLCRRVVC